MAPETRSTTTLYLFECLTCGLQVRSHRHLTTCARCGGDLHDMSHNAE